MATMRRIPSHAAASMMLSAAKAGGTNTIEVFAPVASTAWETESKMGTPSRSVPPLPGVTPATRFVPYSLLRKPWKRPCEPVSPCTTSRVVSST